jgi:hypothetical protein
MVTREQAQSLAVRAAAFADALKEGRANGVQVWGKMLRDKQRELRIEVYGELEIDNALRAHPLPADAEYRSVDVRYV